MGHNLAAYKTFKKDLRKVFNIWSLSDLHLYHRPAQRFSNFFQVGTTFIS